MAHQRFYVLLLIAACALGSAAGASLRTKAMRLAGGAQEDMQCLSYPDATSCLDHGCGWCSNDDLGEQCMPESVAKLVPSSLASCRLPDDSSVKSRVQAAAAAGDDDDDGKGKKPKAPTSCGDNKEKDDCLDLGAEEGDCAWCKGDFMPPSCVATKAAEWIPETVARCKMPKKHKKDDDKQLQAAAAAGGDDDGKGKKPKAPTSCGDNKEKDDCLDLGAEEGDCAWCKGDFMPPSCVATKAAEWIPETVARCKMPKKHKKDDDKQLQAAAAAGGGDDDDDDGKGKKPKAPTSCGDNKEKDDCLDLGAEEGDCAWCKGDFMPPSCVATKAAEWIPETVARCKMPKKHKKDDDKQLQADAAAAGDDDDGKGKKPKAPTSCGDNKEKDDCLDLGAEEGDCAWCKGDFMPPSCVATKAAEWIPETVARCKMPKKHKKDDDQDAAGTNQLDKKHKKDKRGGKGKGGSDWPSGGGDWPSGGGDWPSGGGSGAGGQGCMAEKHRKKCLRTKDTSGGCAWCANSYLGSKCVSESTVKYMPKFIADCEMPKDDKKKSGGGSAVAAS